MGRGPGGQLLPGGRAALQPFGGVAAIEAGLIAQVADQRHRLKDRQVTAGLAQAPPGGGQDGVIQRPGEQVLEGAVQGDPPPGPLEGPGGPAEDRGGIMAQAVGIQADLGIEAQFQEALQITPHQVRERGC